MKIKMLNKRILVEEAKKKKSEFIIIDSNNNEPGLGRVVALASDVDPELKNGSKIYFIKSSFNKVILDGNEYYIIREEDILCAGEKEN